MNIHHQHKSLLPLLGICLAGLLLGNGRTSAQPETGAPPRSKTYKWSLIETAKDTNHRLTALRITSPASATSADSVISCDPQQRCQEIVGIGGALTESAAWTLAQLPAKSRMEVLRRYFDPKDGLGYTVCRTHMNSCDFSLNSWSLDDTPGDVTLTNFTLEPMRRWLMPLIRDARTACGETNFHLLVSTWSPPAWMKSNGEMIHGGSLKPEDRDVWANFFVRFIQAMKQQEGIPVWAVTVQNEPAAKQRWESCLYTAEEERDFVRDHLGPALEKAGLNDVHLLVWDHNRDLLYQRATTVFKDPGASRYVWGAALHWYGPEMFDESSRVHADFPDKALLFTEGCWEGGVKLGQWDRGERYARNMIGDFRNWVCGWIDWNIALNTSGGPNHVGNNCDAPVIVDCQKGEVYYQTSFYYIGHFSRFVKPGAHRIVSSGGPGTLQSVAFVNPDGSVVTVVLNATDTPARFGLSVGGQSLACSIPAHAIQTYVGTPR